MTIEEQAEIGRKWAEELILKKHYDVTRKPVPDSWELTTGWKTSLDLFRTICNMADEARGVDLTKLQAERDELAASLKDLLPDASRGIRDLNSLMVGSLYLDRARSVLAKVERSSGAKSNSQTR